MMRLLKGFILMFLLFVSWEGFNQTEINKDSFSVYAQEDWYEDDPYFWSHTKEIGLNIMPLATQFVPFNFIPRDEGQVGLLYKRYYSKRALRFSFGANMTEEAFENSEEFLFISLGIERRHPVTKDKKISYTSGWDAILNASEFNSFLGMSKIYGLEYHISKRVFLSTEAALLLGLNIGFGAPVIRFRPPATVFFNVRLY